MNEYCPPLAVAVYRVILSVAYYYNKQYRH